MSGEIPSRPLINIDRLTNLKAEDHSPVHADDHGPKPHMLTLEPIQPKAEQRDPER